MSGIAHRTIVSVLLFVGVVNAASAAESSGRCASVVKADVVALDQAFQINRLGATRTDGEIYALRSDVVSTDGPGAELKPGHVMLRPDKRPRPLTLRVNAGSCLEIAFTNLLDPKQKDVLQPVTRNASIHGQLPQEISG